MTCNARYIFPGLALGAALGQTGVVTNAMINSAAEALVELIDEKDLSRRATFPENVDIREIAAHLAARVFEQAVKENLTVSEVAVRLHNLMGRAAVLDCISFLFCAVLAKSQLKCFFSFEY